MLSTFIPEIHDRVQRLYDAGVRTIALKGARRAGKSVYIMQRALTNMLVYGYTVNVSVMTAEQGRLGMYTDAQNIIDNTERLCEYVTLSKTPREVRAVHGGGVMHFNSYPDPERAKGAACDDLVVNEANNFTLKQVQDMMANVRDCTLLDYNQSPDWAGSIIDPAAVVLCRWQDNPYLTTSQIAYFERLKRNAERENATAMDNWLYRTYYLGEDAEIGGEIFTPANTRKCEHLPDNLGHAIIFADPSALRGADYFAMCVGMTDGDCVYIADTFSVNTGGYQLPATKLNEWRHRYDVQEIYVETNGLQGLEFYEFCLNSGIPVSAWTSTKNKFERITANYQGLTEKVVWLDSDNNNDYLAQVYDFGQKCLHDDNIDAANSLYNAYKWGGWI